MNDCIELPEDVILEVAHYGEHYTIRQTSKFLYGRIPKEHCIYKLKIKSADSWGRYIQLKKMVNLTILYCHNRKVSEIPKELVNLTDLHCSNTNMSDIPKEPINLTNLYCHGTNVSEIPKELIGLKNHRLYPK